jgi:phosphate-selective porin OprO/OprP
MAGNGLKAGLVLALALGILAPTACAADDSEIRKIVQEEIKAAADKKKKEQGEVMTVKWKEGLKFESNNKEFKAHVGGRIMIDAYFYDDDDWVAAGGDDQGDGAEFRAARLEISGDIYKHTTFKLQVDFGNTSKGTETDVEVAYKDVYIGLKNLKDCWGCAFPEIYVGHFKEYFSLEELTSSRFTTFLERGLPNVFAPGRNTGIGITDSLRGGQLNYGVGLFGEANDGGFADFEHFEDGDGLAFTARVAYAPWWDCNCECNRLHLGLAYSHRFDIGEVRYRQRPEAHLRDRLVDTGTFDAESVDLFGAEVALVYGPFSVQAEYILTNVTSETENDPSFSGWYVYATYFLTGECRNYSKGKFDRIKPCCNFLYNDCCCKGGWEVALRYSYLDLTDEAIVGGEETNWTLGVNWYLNPCMKIMANYILADVEDNDDGISETLSIFGIRFQVDF